MHRKLSCAVGLCGIAAFVATGTGQQTTFAQGFRDDLGLGNDHSEPCDPITVVVEDDDQPKPPLVYIDPARFVPEPLARPIDLDLADIPLAEAMQRVSEATGLPGRIDVKELDNEGVQVDTIVSDRAESEPAYLLLDRILENVAGVELGWFVDQGILEVTTKLVADDHLVTITDNVRDLLERGYCKDDILDVILNTTSGPWFDLDGVGGTLEFFGEMLVVRQTSRVQREVAAMLDAIRERGLERRVGEPLTHAELERKLDQVVAAEFSKTSLRELVETLSRDYALRMWIDVTELKNEGITPDNVVSLPAAQLPIRSALHLALADVGGVELWAIVDKNAIRITTKIVADDIMLPVVYDVGDLTDHNSCRMSSLQNAVEHQTSGPWFNLDGVGGTMESAGNLLVVRQTGRVHAEIRTLLADLRAGIAESQANGWDDRFPIELKTHYYRIDTDVADELIWKIPELIAPGTWARTVDEDGETVELAPEGVGTIDRLTGGRRLVAIAGAPGKQDDGNADQSAAAQDDSSGAVVIPRTVLIIKHCNSVHQRISSLMKKLNTSPGSTSRESDFGPGISGDTSEFRQWGGGFGSVAE